MRKLILFLGICALLSLRTNQPAALGQPALPERAAALHNTRLGIAHISAAEGGTAEARYQRALVLGAGWNRWPLYWDRAQTAPDVWNWAAYDRQVVDDLRHGLEINAILLGHPAFYADDEIPQGIGEPIFADGSDLPGDGQAINPANPWAVFVYAAVSRYRPGGALASTLGLGAEQGIRVWEVWNEPDHRAFWRGSIREYARLLKVAYIVAHHADPGAQVMFGGLLFPTQDNWLARVLEITASDPLREQFNWYMDLIAVHSYSDPWRSGWLVLNVRQTLVAYGLARPIWVNETGVAVWDDYPGPTWARSPVERVGRATMQQQAWYLIQSAAYAWVEGAEVVIFHQLYDDCGDQPPGTTFPPNDGSLCSAGAACSGDAFGLLRNETSSVCFNQHPQPGSSRAAAQAYALLAQVFAQPFGRGQVVRLANAAPAMVMEFPRDNGEKVIVLWNRTFQPFTLMLPAEGTHAQVIDLEAERIITPDASGHYALFLPPAQPDDYPEPPPGADAAIGGSPLIVIERPEGAITPLVIRRTLDASAAQTGLPAPTAPPAPTTDPAHDTRPPVAAVFALPEVSPATFRVQWGGRDNSGIQTYIVWVRVDDGRWSRWLQTRDEAADYSGEPGRVYAFAVWAQDLAGNWSENVALQPQAITRVE